MACARSEDQVVKVVTLVLADHLILLLVKARHRIADKLDASALEVFGQIHRDLFGVKVLKNHSRKGGANGGARLVGDDHEPMLGIEQMTQPPRCLDARKRTADDDCCFCCCSHVLPGTVVANVAVIELRSQVSFLEYISVPSPTLARAFHPPRSV